MQQLEPRTFLAGTVTVDGLFVTIVGTAGDDQITINQSSIFPAPHANVVVNGETTLLDSSKGGQYHFSVSARDGNDTVQINNAFDRLTSTTVLGGRGADEINIACDQASRVLVKGGGGNDHIKIATAFSDFVPGVPGPGTVVHGDDGNDKITTGEMYDSVFGGRGNDTLLTCGGNDTLYGDAGDDVLIGGDENDSLYGGEGNDLLDGGDGDDRLLGNAGNDTLIGNAGSDVLIGGPGHDFDYPDAPSSRLRRFLQTLFE